MSYFHQPVLLNELLEYLDLKPNDNVIDCTVGGGGHALAILEKTAPKGHLLGLDRDPKAIEASAQRLLKFQNRITLIKNTYKNLNNIINEQQPFIQFNHLLLDLGLSSAQLAEEDSRGFSFRSEKTLDMRFGPDTDLTAAEILNKWPKDDLIKIFKEYGEERFAKKIVEKIILFRTEKLLTATSDLVKIIEEAYRGRRGKTHPATKVFQALRIAVNDELGVLKKTLPQMLKILPQGGRLAVISYHSLEDRIVKQFFKEEAKDCLCPKEIPVCRCNHPAQIKILTKKPVVPSAYEVEQNPRSRSAKLRVAEKI